MIWICSISLSVKNISGFVTSAKSCSLFVFCLTAAYLLCSDDLHHNEHHRLYQAHVAAHQYRCGFGVLKGGYQGVVPCPVLVVRSHKRHNLYFHQFIFVIFGFNSIFGYHSWAARCKGVIIRRGRAPLCGTGSSQYCFQDQRRQGTKPATHDQNLDLCNSTI